MTYPFETFALVTKTKIRGSIGLKFFASKETKATEAVVDCNIQCRLAKSDRFGNNLTAVILLGASKFCFKSN